jgi:RNA polymerase sigma-70 factor (ECF subfamily)
MAETAAPPQEPNDAELLAAIAGGDEAAFVTLYGRRHADVYRFAYAMAKSRGFAQDAAQEVFLNVLENAARFDPAKGSVRAWLFGCARYVVLDRLRLERRWTDQQVAEPSGPGSDEEVLSQERVARLHAAVAQLPLEYRETLVLCELQELSYAETAVALDCPIGTVRSRLHRARALLATLLAENDAAAADDAIADDGGALRPSEVCS